MKTKKNWFSVEAVKNLFSKYRGGGGTKFKIGNYNPLPDQ
jgi:hypothetical protein